VAERQSPGRRAGIAACCCTVDERKRSSIKLKALLQCGTLQDRSVNAFAFNLRRCPAARAVCPVQMVIQFDRRLSGRL